MIEDGIESIGMSGTVPDYVYTLTKDEDLT